MDDGKVSSAHKTDLFYPKQRTVSNARGQTNCCCRCLTKATTTLSHSRWMDKGLDFFFFLLLSPVSFLDQWRICTKWFRSPSSAAGCKQQQKKKEKLKQKYTLVVRLVSSIIIQQKKKKREKCEKNENGHSGVFSNIWIFGYFLSLFICWR